ncbi:MAG: hypothetical protein OEL87_03570 [Nanoarchaeota archaeon]|nr:hypothetical protein [Nanoarchaeota archaeon]
MKSDILSFLLGFLSCLLLFTGILYFNSSIPSITGFATLNDNVMPSNWISEDNITVFKDMIVLRVLNATISDYADTGSMKPLLDKGANGIRITPKNENEINVGDIVSYKFKDILVVHRVVEKGTDDKGIYFITQGDNNILSDGKIRFDDIEYVTIGIIW